MSDNEKCPNDMPDWIVAAKELIAEATLMDDCIERDEKLHEFASEHGMDLITKIEQQARQLAAAQQEAKERANWPRCETCCCELQDGGEGVGYKCPVCDARDRAEQAEADLAAANAKLAAVVEARQAVKSASEAYYNHGSTAPDSDDTLPSQEWLDISHRLQEAWNQASVRLMAVLDDLPAAASEMMAELERLRKLEAKLPKTADGVAVWPDKNGDWPKLWYIAGDGKCYTHIPWRGLADIPTMYSTEAAARQEKASHGGKGESK